MSCRESVIEMSGMTTISVGLDTEEMPKRLRSQDQTFDDVIRQLVEGAATEKLDRRWNLILEEEFIPLESV